MDIKNNEYEIVKCWGKPWDYFKNYGDRNVAMLSVPHNENFSSNIAHYNYKITAPLLKSHANCLVCGRPIEAGVRAKHIVITGKEHGKRLQREDFYTHKDCIEIII